MQLLLLFTRLLQTDEKRCLRDKVMLGGGFMAVVARRRRPRAKVTEKLCETR